MTFLKDRIYIRIGAQIRSLTVSHKKTGVTEEATLYIKIADFYP